MEAGEMVFGRRKLEGAAVGHASQHGARTREQDQAGGALPGAASANAEKMLVELACRARRRPPQVEGKAGMAAEQLSQPGVPEDAERGMNDGLFAGMTVLVVEDEYLIALEAQRMIEEAGVGAVLLASSIGEVRKLLADGPRIDAAVLDLGLGTEDATPLIGAFADGGIPLLVATGFDAGAPDGIPCLVKPYGEAELIEAIRHLTKRR